ncbi:MAG TPA: YceI family protein [Terracidiphilus sp.]|jgi:polyisoprenoid-binding protein YceI|nr:YceI family protein [Terracidiphilus sp.]
MKRPFSALAILILAAPLAAHPAHAQATGWTIDPNHSEVDFTVRHMSLTKVHGRFGKVTGTIQLDQNDLSKSSVQVTIDVSGVDTGVTSRDNDLKSASFFNVAQFPTATFTSTSVAKSANGLTVTGNLTLHGITRPVTLEVEGPEGPVPGMGNKLHTGYSATAAIDRTAFDIGTKYPNAMLSNQIELTIEVDAIKQ